MRAFPMLRALGFPVVFDVTHSLQLPGAGDGVTAGQAEYIEPMASAGVAAGVDGVFMEVHERPEQARSDAQNALRLDLLEPLLHRLVRMHEIAADRPRRCRRKGVPRSPLMADEHGHAGSRPHGAADRGGGDSGPGRRLDDDFERAVELLFECRGRVAVTGMGKSGIICRKIAATLSSTGTPAFFLHPAEAIHGDLGALRDEDVVLAMSHSGETEEVIRLLESIRRIGAQLIAITGEPRSTLARAADVTLDCGIARKPARSTSRRPRAPPPRSRSATRWR